MARTSVFGQHLAFEGQFRQSALTARKFATIPAELRFAEVQYCFGVRYGTPAIYAKTFDRVADTHGRPWGDALGRARDTDPTAFEFPSADIPFVSSGDLCDSKANLLVAAGDVLGHSVSITGWKPFQRFLRASQRAGIDIRNASVRLDLGFEARKNHKGEWGVLTFSNVQRNFAASCGVKRSLDFI